MKVVKFSVGKSEVLYMRKGHSEFSLRPCKILMSQLAVTD